MVLADSVRVYKPSNAKPVIVSGHFYSDNINVDISNLTRRKLKEKYLTFEDAKNFVLGLKLKSNSEWRFYCRSGQKPKNIPVNPDRTYKQLGWVNWTDWLGSNTKPNENPLLKFDRKEIQKILTERFFEKVNQNNGEVLNGIYVNKHSLFLFRCKNGHEWEAQAQTILSGSWCRKCFNDQKAGKHLVLKDGLQQAINIATERKGKCLSVEYLNNKRLLKFECNNGHQWNAALTDIRKGTWCPYCGKGIRERLCRNIFEQITSHQFPKKRPNWLLNLRGKQMELDGFCEKLNVAFEHHGEYHYLRNKHFQRKNESLERRIVDDKTKANLCKKHNVNLIIVPYSIKTSQLKYFIFQELYNIKLNIKLNENIIDNYVVSNELEELNNIAEQRGGKCLSNIYLGVDKKHIFQCSEGHIWEAIPANIKSKRKSWCPTCKSNRIGDSNRKYSLTDMQNIADKKSGKFLSSTFKSVNYKYIWQCEVGHQWNAAPVDILRGRWCKVCSISNKKDSIFEMQRLAESKNGLCISTEYVNSQTKLVWQCEHGHQWEAKPNSVRHNNSWCPYCSGRKKRAANRVQTPKPCRRVKPDPGAQHKATSPT